MDNALYRLDRSGLTPVRHIPTPERFIIDSFLSRQGRILGLDLHLARFAASIPRLLPEHIEGHLAAVIAGRTLFPRLEYHCDTQEIYLRLRPAPTWRSHTRLWVAGPDQRERPDTKGWDLRYLESLRAQAIARGADDALLLDPATGHPLETTTGALAWKGTDGALHTPGPGARVLPSTTVARYRRAGHQLAEAWLPLEELTRHPLWVGNAVHGWTPASILEEKH